MAYAYFTKEQLEKANSTDLAELLQSRGETLKRSGSEWQWRDSSDKVTIRGNEWFHQYDREGGGAIKFVQRFCNLDFPDAVQILLGNEFVRIEPSESKPKESLPFSLPPPNSDMRRVYAYLLKTRFIDRDIIHYFAHNKMLYEDAKYHNAVFVGYDENGVPKHAHKRGTYGESSYKGNETGSQPEYSFHHTGTSNKLFVFEAPVDMLSYLTLHKKDWKKHSYAALCCTGTTAALHQLKQHPNIDEVIVCTDHDKAGIEAYYRIKDAVAEIGEYAVRQEQAQNKDWNEDIREQNGLEPIPSAEHPGMEQITELCSELAADCCGEKCPKYPYEVLTEQYEKLKRIPKNRTENIQEQSYDMARVAFLFCAARHRQMGMPFEEDWYAEKMCAQYKPHKDGGGYGAHLSDIGENLRSVLRDYSEDKIYTKSEVEQQIDRTLSIGLDCLRLYNYVGQQEQSEAPQLTL